MDKCHRGPLTLCSDGTLLLTTVIHSPLTHKKNFNKRLSISIYIIYPWSVTCEVQIVFQTLRPLLRDFIHFSSRCIADKVPSIAPISRLCQCFMLNINGEERFIAYPSCQFKIKKFAYTKL